MVSLVGNQKSYLLLSRGHTRLLSFLPRAYLFLRLLSYLDILRQILLNTFKPVFLADTPCCITVSYDIKAQTLGIVVSFLKKNLLKQRTSFLTMGNLSHIDPAVDLAVLIIAGPVVITVSVSTVVCSYLIFFTVIIVETVL